MSCKSAGALSLLFSWYYQPYFPAANQALYVSKSLPIAATSPFAPGLFDLRGVTFAAWTLAAFSIGVFAGVLIRRSVPAIVATLVSYTVLAVAVGGFVRQRYLAPLVITKVNVPNSVWVTGQQWFTESGRPVRESTLHQILQSAPGQLFGKDGVPKSVTVWQYLAQRGLMLSTRYQPASRYWPFQWIEASWLLVLSALLIAGTLWIVRGRAS